MLEKKLKEKDYLPILNFNDGSEVTRESWDRRRKEMRELLEKHSYGHTPASEVKVSGETIEKGKYICAGKCSEELVRITYETEYGKGEFPIQIFAPNNVKNPPVFVSITLDFAPHRYLPVEEIIDNGYALVVIAYKELVNDNYFGDYSDGIAKHFGTVSPRSEEEWGKIGMWAWGTSRVLDYLFDKRSEFDTSKIAVIGHSRLGKTALWCAALDERVTAAISNNSGYGGAASSKHGHGERIEDFFEYGSWDWFCENFKKYKGELEDEKPYDQSFLLALIAPRYLLVGSAELDAGADPEAEFLTTLHASTAWELLGEKGLITKNEMPAPGAFLGEGNILYHYRTGSHYLSRDDWRAYMKFLNKKFGI